MSFGNSLGPDRANRLTVASVVAAPADTSRIEVEVHVPRAVRARLVKRSRPIVAVRTCITERAIATTPGRRQENIISI